VWCWEGEAGAEHVAALRKPLSSPCAFGPWAMAPPLRGLPVAWAQEWVRQHPPPRRPSLCPLLLLCPTYEGEGEHAAWVVVDSW
jgi:hypothetical protein